MTPPRDSAETLRAWLKADGTTYWVCVGPSTEDVEAGRDCLVRVDALLLRRRSHAH
ncbi:MAG TPA: hypothetical protein VK573_03000 [Gemmatimonadales bacterium]|nr:hypothetical protein [Gemmatimonadales bacterium]